MQSILLLVPDMPGYEDLAPYMRRMDESRRYTNAGPLAGELEAALAARHLAPDRRSPHAVALANATLGLQLTLEALALKPEARVLVPGLTFPASVLAILHAGLTPVICDVDGASWLLTPSIARRAMQNLQFDAVMPVSTFGCAQDAAAWDAFAIDAGIPVVIDAAGAFGNQPAGRLVHTVLSLHATKTLGAGEGGALLTHDAQVAQRVRSLSNFGYDNDTGLVVALGTNAKLSEYHAAVALAALQLWDAKAQVRKELHARYLQDLRTSCPVLRLQLRPAAGAYSILSVMLPPDRNALDATAFLARHDIETRRWYCPIVPDHPAFRQLTAAGSLEVSRMLGERLVGLPFHPFLAPQEVERVVAALKSHLGS